MAIFQPFFLRQYRPRICVLRYSRTKNAFLDYKNKKFKKSKKLRFFQRGQPMVLVQKWPFFQLFFLFYIGQKNLFYDIREQKKPFLTKKTWSLKSRKIEIFPKGLTHALGPKIAIFLTFFLRHHKPQKGVLRYSKMIRRLSTVKKNKQFKKAKNWDFSKGVNPWFWSKNGHFPTFFLKQYRPRKCVVRYSRTKNAFLDYKNNKFKKSKNWDFFKGVNPWFLSKNGHFSHFFS